MTQLDSLLARGRGPLLDFVSEPTGAALGELIVAFANGMGGTIIAGMDPGGRVYPNAIESLEPALGRALSLCEPALRAVDLPEWNTLDTPWGQIATIVVKPTPYQVSVRGTDVFVRSGMTNVLLNPEETQRYSSGRRLTSLEDDVVPGASSDDFEEAVIEEYQANRVKRGPRGESFTRQDLLRDAGAIDSSGAPTVAGILLFGRNPQHFFPQVGVVVVRFKGESIRDVVASSERYSRRVELVGPAARLVERAWEVLFEEIHQESVLNGLARVERFSYPPQAVREALVNAICHRDYDIAGQRIEVRLFDNRMEIMSPGGLPGHITLANMLDEHYSRNPRLVRGLYQWGYIEELGQGIDIIYDAMRRYHHPAPDFGDTGRSFTVTLYNAVNDLEAQFGEEINPRQIRALRYLGEHERISNRQYRQLCPDVSTETIRLDLRDLVEKGILLKIGDKRGTSYVRK